MHYVLGAPGSGKSALAPLLRPLLPGRVVLDWDALMDPAGALAGRPIRRDPTTWSSYADLVRAVVAQLQPVPVVLLTVCTPEELDGWPSGRWLLLDCHDAARRARLDPTGVQHALTDAAAYRALGLPVLDTTAQPLPEAARLLATSITGPGDRSR